MDEGRDDAPQAIRRRIIQAIELGDSAALGGDLRLELHPRTTVIVGENGAGKSALLETFVAAAAGATGAVAEEQPDPRRFACEIAFAGAPEAGFVRYECRWQARAERPAAEEALGEEGLAEIEERALHITPYQTVELWRLADGKAVRNDGQTDMLPRGRGLLHWWMAHRKSFVFTGSVDLFQDLFWLVMGHYVRAGVPRGAAGRSELIFPYPWLRAGRRGESAYDPVPFQLRRLALTIADWRKDSPERLEEFTAVARRLKLFDRVDIRAFPEAGPGGRDLLSISADGTNLGLLSDGTLRVAEIVSLLVNPEVRLLLIEEPEIAVHPGLLGRLLHEIETYSTDRQVVLSTQSPQVVNWAKPAQLRLVTRESGRTQVRALDEAERAQVDAYLHDEGTLGEFVYSGALGG